MDLVTCEAPLDNSFQKDRRELVNKGSLGRRRKPSRSNLRVILSPAKDQQDINVFHGHHHIDSDGSFIQVNVSPATRVKESALDNQQESVTTDYHIPPTKNQHRNNQSEIPHLSVACNNYREVVASINQIYSLKSVDLNGNNHQPVSVKSGNRQNTASPLDHVEAVRDRQQKQDRSENNSVDSKHLQISFAKNQQNVNIKNRQPNGQLGNVNCDIKCNGYDSNGNGRSQKVTDSRNNHQILKVSNQQKAVASKNHLNIITFSNHRQISTSSPVQYKISAEVNGKRRELASLLNDSSQLHKDVSLDENMLYRAPDDRHRRVQETARTVNGGVTINGNSSVQEPEWISLSRKLCAKFVEGHIEPHSPDSYPYEEPEGVGEESIPSLEPKTHSGGTPQIQVDVQKRKLIPAAFCEESSSSNEPPWIHLSRKLCNKFIEEHIEYPPITNGHFVEVPDLVEPNGDVRIIEKVGKPKGHKSKQKKECEPEWVSLSKKLRAKFIESHIDDPDTIALDNQLNASDPEETNSETLSDISQDISVSKESNISQDHLQPVECRNFTVRSQVIEHKSAFQEHGNQPRHDASVAFPDKECCWEYQEMEFDQESNSGNFQEPEYNEEPLQEARIRRGSLPQDASDPFAELVTFSNSENIRSFQIPECYNNDVKFLPYFSNENDASDNQQHNKLITVKFIAHAENDERNELKNDNNVPHHTKNNEKGSFFNLSTWEEAHCKQDVDGRQNSEEITPSKNVLSKSLDNSCDSLDEKSLMKFADFEKIEGGNSAVSAGGFGADDKVQADSEDPVSRKGNEIFLHEFKLEPVSASDVSYVQESANCASQNMISEHENRVVNSNSFNHTGKEQNIFYNTQEVDSSSEDEVFEPLPLSKKQISNNPEVHYGKISARKSPVLERERRADQVQVTSEKVKNDHCNKNGKNIKCNGMIPNSIYDGFPDNRSSSSKHNQSANQVQHVQKEPVKLGMSKWITMSRSEQNISKPEYSNLKPIVQTETKNAATPSRTESGSKNKSKKNNNESKINAENKVSSNKNISPQNIQSSYESDYAADFNRTDDNSNRFNGFPKEFDLKSKCKSLCDISHSSNSFANENSFKHHESVADLCSGRHIPNSSQIEFQHFGMESEIPLCAKLVSNHNKKMLLKNVRSASPTNRTDSPCPSESSHVYEDMFKETPSGPSDSEASSWVMKNNTYYINGRSSSMNDLDFSDSCSLSMKCDYASSSENSTLQSRHSSYASSSFYVNLRDYDSHMLEPALNREKKTNGRLTNNGTTSLNVSKSNPPTPESLRHLFTSPLSSIHSPPNRTPRPLSRMPSDPQSHYYSTAAATSSAFKHGFALTPPKPKKAERSSSIKIKDIAHGIILTFKRFQNHSKNSSVSSTQQVDVSHLAEMKSNSELGKTDKGQKNSKKKNHDKGYGTENGKTDTDSGFLSDVQRAKARRSSSDLTGMKSNSELFSSDKKKSKNSKKSSNRDKGKKSRSKASEPRTVPTVSRKVQQMADGTLYLVTTVSGDTALPGVYSDSPDTSSELSSHKPVKPTGESNC